MTSSLTITLSSDTKSYLEANFVPEVILDEKCEYHLALLDLIIKQNKTNDNLEKINELGVIHVDCDLVYGSYINGVQSHTIYQFATTPLAKGRKLITEIPKHLNYFPLKTKNLRSIHISIIDQQGNLVNTFGGEIICRINIKRDNSEKSTT